MCNVVMKTDFTWQFNEGCLKDLSWFHSEYIIILQKKHFKRHLEKTASWLNFFLKMKENYVAKWWILIVFSYCHKFSLSIFFFFIIYLRVLCTFVWQTEIELRSSSADWLSNSSFRASCSLSCVSVGMRSCLFPHLTDRLAWRIHVLVPDATKMLLHMLYLFNLDACLLCLWL